MNGFVPQELDEKLASRVQVSQRAVAKIIQVFDHLNQRHERLSRMIRGEDPADKEDEGKLYPTQQRSVRQLAAMLQPQMPRVPT